MFWNEVREQFSKAEEHLPLEVPVETETPQQPQAQMLTEIPRPRIWLLNGAGTELIQLQGNRFTRNWRQLSESDTYPRYAYVRERFSIEFEAFQRFAEREGLGLPAPNSCEVTYVNHVAAAGGIAGFADIHRVVAGLRPHSGVFLPQPNDLQYVCRFKIHDDHSRFLGRLTVTVQPGIRRRDNVAIVILTLTARGIPSAGSLQGALEFFDIGHEWIVRGFADMTTPEMHQAWERTK